MGFISFFSEEGGIPGRLELEFAYRDCTEDQPCGSGEGHCDSDDECEPGLVCEFGIEDRFDQPEGVGICWDPGCRTDPWTVGCGWRGDPCGICPCVPDCSTQSCGSDGCGGTCNDYCDIGDPCELDIDCGNHQVCDVIDSNNNRACVPSSCTNRIHDTDETDRDCGGDCKACSEACTKEFCRSGEQINPDPLAALSFSIGNFTRESYTIYETENGTRLARPNVLRYEDLNDGNGRVALFQGAEEEHAADVLVFESSNVPSWMRSGMWQFDVYPYYSSEELAASTDERVLFSFDPSSDRIVLRPEAGSAKLAIITDGFTRHERELTWSVHQKMTITFNTSGGAVTVRGASSNNGEQSTLPFYFSSGRLRVGGLLDDAGEANARISEPRRVSQSSITCTKEPNFCTADCPCDRGQGGCTSDDQCQLGLVCEPNMGERFGLPADFGVCWSAVCRSPHDPRAHCGSADAACGICPPCVPNCTDKSCGSDGCWGSCGEECGQGEAGCNSNADCAYGLVCGVDNGFRFGRAADVRVCWPEICEESNQTTIPCGSITDPCGLCPFCDPIANCAGRQCGPDGCGGRCEQTTPDTNQYCDEIKGVWAERRYTQKTSGETLFVRNIMPTNDSWPSDVNTNKSTAWIGTLPGTFEVSHDGAATYRIPIEAPPGRAGVEPELALVYDSDKPNGYLGVGWGLDCLSTITRCGQTVAQDGRARGVKFDNDDRFCVDGNRLVLVNGSDGYSYGSDGATYRKEIDDFTKFVQHGGGDLGPDYFEAYTAEGRIPTYGKEGYFNSGTPFLPIPEVPINETGVTQTWSLSEVRDRVGNTMKVAYLTNIFKIDTGVSRISYRIGIVYTGFNGSPGYATVEFFYKERNDRIKGYKSGIKISQSLLLKTIKTTVEKRLVREYRLTYQEPPEREPTFPAWPYAVYTKPENLHLRSLLKSVAECAQRSSFSDDPVNLACKPETEFEYDAIETGFADPEYPEIEQPYPKPGVMGLSPIAVADVNGNGIDDILMPDDDDYKASRWLVLLDNEKLIDTGIWREDRAITWEEYFLFIELPGGKMMNKSYLHPGNYYQNGADQLVEWDVIRMGYDTDYRIFRWNGENLSEFDTGIPISISSSNDYEENILRVSNTYTIDADGDGLTDLISCQYNKSKSSKHNKYYDWRINFGARDGMGFGDSVDLDDASIALSLMSCGAGIKVNFDKSGADVLLVETFPPYHFAENPDGTGLYRVDDVKYYNTLEFPSGQPSGSSVDLKMRFVNIDRTDLIIVPMDYNGDGLIDLVQLKDIKEGKKLRPRIYLWANSGYDFVEDRDQPLDTSLYCEDEPHGLGAFFGATVIDENGDGRDDLLFYSHGEDHGWQLLRSKGNSFQHVETGDELKSLDLRYGRGSGVVAYDADGDGRKDIGSFDDCSSGPCYFNNWKILRRKGPKKYMLKAITNGMRVHTEIDYSDLNDKNVYTHENINDGSCTYPISCKLPHKTVVKEHREWDGKYWIAQSPARSYTYSYGGGRSDELGRGWLGFSSRKVVHNERKVGTELKATTAYSFDNVKRDPNTGTYPYAGRPKVEAYVVPMAWGRVKINTITRFFGFQYDTGGNLYRHVPRIDIGGQRSPTISMLERRSNRRLLECFWGLNEV